MFTDQRTYVDFDGNERTENFYFNLTQAEVTEMELSTHGGLDKYIEGIVAAQDVPSIIAFFKELITKSYGVKSADGKFFKKSQEELENYMSTTAFSDLYMELASNTEKATAFVNGITPKMPEDHKKKEISSVK